MTAATQQYLKKSSRKKIRRRHIFKVMEKCFKWWLQLHLSHLRKGSSDHVSQSELSSLACSITADSVWRQQAKAPACREAKNASGMLMQIISFLWYLNHPVWHIKYQWVNIHMMEKHNNSVYQENIEFLKIFLILANLIGHSFRGISTVDSKYLLQITASNYNRLY